MPVPQAAEGNEDDDGGDTDQADAPTDETESESASKSAQATITDTDDGDSPDGDGDTPDVDPADIDTVSVDGFDEVDETVDEALDELNEATERAEAESEANGGTDEDTTADIDVADTSLGEESPFKSTESESDYEYGSTGSEGQDPFGSSESDSQDDNLDEIIIEGFARLAVVKVEPSSEQSALQDEFEEVFEAFRLGHFGREVVQEYLIVDEHDDIDPLWGFVGSLFMCLVVVMWMRPDSDQILGTGSETIRDFVDKVRT